MPEYFLNLKNPKEGNTVNWKDLELHVPEGFRKHLNSMEKHRLLNGQLAEYGLMLGDGYGEYSELIRMKSMPAPPEKSASNRLREYLTLFDAEQRKNRYKNIEKTEISRQIDGVINHICEEINNDKIYIEDIPRTTEALASLVEARNTIKTAPCTINEQINHETILQLCRPAFDYLRENFDPYVTIRINSDGIEVTRAICGIPEKAVNKR